MLLCVQKFRFGLVLGHSSAATILQLHRPSISTVRSTGQRRTCFNILNELTTNDLSRVHRSPHTMVAIQLALPLTRKSVLRPIVISARQNRVNSPKVYHPLTNSSTPATTRSRRFISMTMSSFFLLGSESSIDCLRSSHS